MATTTPGANVPKPRESEAQESLSLLEFTPESFRAAADHFRDFFGEIGEHMIEREDLVRQLQLALLSGQHVLMLGHPGTAKSVASRLILDRIVGRDGTPNSFDMQFQVESRRAEVMGPRLPQTDPQSGVMKLVARIEEGIANSDYAFLDEIFDAPPAVLRGALLTILVDRVINDGRFSHAIKLRSALAASNKTMAYLRSKFGDELDALLDRFAFVYWTTKRPLEEESSITIIGKAGERTVAKNHGKTLGMEVEPMQISEMDVLQQAVVRVQEQMIRQQWPLKLAAKFYRNYHTKMDHAEEELGQRGNGGGRSKLESQRTQNVMISLLPAIAVMRHIQNPDTPLAVMPEDFEALRMFFMMRGPQVSDLPADLEEIGNREDQRILRRLQIEERTFIESLDEVIRPAAHRLRAAMPTNFPAIQDTVSDWKRRLEPGGTPLVRTEISNGLTDMEDLMHDLAGLSSQATQGEEVYADAVVTYLQLLTLAIGVSGGVDRERRKFRSAKLHVDALANSFYRSTVANAVEGFRSALAASYTQVSTGTGGATEMMTALSELETDSDILGEGAVVGTLADAFKTAALDRVLAGAVAVSDVEAACSEYEQMCQLHAVIATEGIGGRIPLDRLIEMHTRTLETLKVMVKQATQAVSGGTMQPDDRDALLTRINRALTAYKKGIQQNHLGALSGEQLPDTMVTDYLAEKQPDKAANHSGATVEGRVLSRNGEENVKIGWRVKSTTDRDLDKKTMQDAYKAFCLEHVVENDGALLAIPEIASLNDRLLLMAETMFRQTWNPEFAPYITERLLETVRTIQAQKSAKDINFEWPFTPADITLMPVPVKATSMRSAIAAAAVQAASQDEQVQAFLETQNIQATATNVHTFGTFLRAKTVKAGTVQVPVETIEVEEEDVPVQDIIDNATSGLSAGWGDLHSEIDSGLNALGDRLAGQLIAERLASVTGTAGAAVDAAGFEAKWGTFFGSDAPTSSWDQIPVDMSASREVTDALSADVTALIDGVTVDPTSRIDHMIEPLQTVQAFLAGLTSIQTTSFVDQVETAAQAKVEEWVTGRAKSRTESVAAVVGISDASSEARIGRINEAVTEIMGLMIEEQIQATTALEAAGNTFTVIEQAAQEAWIKEIADSGATGLVSLAQEAMQALSGLKYEDIGFDMSDLTTLTAANLETVKQRLLDSGCVRTIDQIVTTVEEYLQENATVVAPQRATDLATVKAAATALKDKYSAQYRKAQGDEELY